MEKEIGRTKDVGYQFGVRKTFPIAPPVMWDFLFSTEGLVLWLGEVDGELEVKKEFSTPAGITGKVRVFKPYSHIRLNWRKNDWPNLSILQIRVIDNNGKATVSFHQEKLLDLQQRSVMKDHWGAVLEKLVKVFES
jgi:uncharacterized protein YndB with AHSA1/START domain